MINDEKKRGYGRLSLSIIGGRLFIHPRLEQRRQVAGAVALGQLLEVVAGAAAPTLGLKMAEASSRLMTATLRPTGRIESQFAASPRPAGPFPRSGR